MNRTCSQQLLAPYKLLIDNSSKTNYKRVDWLDNRQFDIKTIKKMYKMNDINN